jgi:exonuclease VII large subunit
VRTSLDAAAAAFFAGYRDRLVQKNARLDAARRLHPGPEALDVLATHLQNTAARIRSKRHDYARAFDRLAEGRLRDLRRKLGAAERDVVSDSQRLRPAADRALARHAERVAHLGALIDAKDFRRLGWLLASNEHGQAVRTVADLNRGDAVHLRFADGEATATVNDIEPQQQGDGHE